MTGVERNFFRKGTLNHLFHLPRILKISPISSDGFVKILKQIQSDFFR